MLKLTAKYANYLKFSAPSLLSPKISVFPQQQTRNTYILKRQNPPGLHKKHGKAQLKPRHFIYDLVEDTNTKKQDPIKIILLKDIEKLGPAGAIIAEKPNRAYERLLLPKLAVYATPENVKKFATKDLSSGRCYTATDLAVIFLSAFNLTVEMSLDNPWILEKRHIRINFRKVGIHVPEDAITMPKHEIIGPNLEFQHKQFYVTVTVDDQRTVNVKCRIHHFTTDLQRQLPIDHDSWMHETRAIFPEDQEILDKMPTYTANRQRLEKKEHTRQVL